MSSDCRRLDRLPQQWRAFLEDLDAMLDAPVIVHCIGGFVLVAHYGATRATKDIDYLFEFGKTNRDLQSIAGEGTLLAKKHGVYVQRVTVACYPEDYETRIEEIFPGELHDLRLMALDPYDLILTKLDRNNDNDRADAKFLANKLHLKGEVLKERYLKEFRPNFVGDEKRLDLTFKLWTEAYFGGTT
jgi:hypothetical protein